LFRDWSFREWSFGEWLFENGHSENGHLESGHSENGHSEMVIQRMVQRMVFVPTFCCEYSSCSIKTIVIYSWLDALLPNTALLGM
jgi:hypothetical protein